MLGNAIVRLAGVSLAKVRLRFTPCAADVSRALLGRVPHLVAWECRGYTRQRCASCTRCDIRVELVDRKAAWHIAYAACGCTHGK